MKKFLLSVFILLSIQLFSQTNFRFADSTAQWNVLREPFSCTAPPNSQCFETLITKFEKDTVINGRSYQKLSGNGYGQLSPYYFYKDSLQRVFRLIDSNYLIYDFSKHAGDTIHGNDYSVPITTLVDSVDTIFMVYPRKRMFVNYWGLKDIWIEGIGSIYTNFLYPGGSALLVDYGIDSLLCYSENNQVLYHLTSTETR